MCVGASKGTSDRSEKTVQINICHLCHSCWHFCLRIHLQFENWIRILVSEQSFPTHWKGHWTNSRPFAFVQHCSKMQASKDRECRKQCRFSIFRKSKRKWTTVCNCIFRLRIQADSTLNSGIYCCFVSFYLNIGRLVSGVSFFSFLCAHDEWHTQWKSIVKFILSAKLLPNRKLVCNRKKCEFPVKSGLEWTTKTFRFW